MIDRIDIIEAVAKSVDVPIAYVNLAVIEATLDAMLPLIKAQLADKVRGGDIIKTLGHKNKTLTGMKNGLMLVLNMLHN